MTFELKGCDEKSFLLFLKQWEIYHADDVKDGDAKDYFENASERFEAYKKDGEKIEEIYKNIGHLINNDFVTGVQAIYYFGRDSEGREDFYKEYCDFYNDYYYNTYDGLECRLDMLFEKANFKLFVIKALLKLGRKDILKNIEIDDDYKERLNITDNDLI